MQASRSASAGILPASSVRTNPRVLTATAAVIVIHVVLLVVVLTLRNEPTQVQVQSRVMTAQLLSPAPVATPVAVESIATPPPKPTPPVHTKPKIQPKPAPTPKPTPLPQAAAPSPDALAAPDPTPSAAAAPAAPAAPAPGPQTMQISAPKNVSHLDCNVVKPDYPMLSRRRSETGTALVQFVVGLSGRLENIQLKKSSGYPRLDDAAVAAAHATTCKPYLENGQPVRAAWTQPYDFSLND
jgi:periplasmic protein TonB